MTDDVGRIAKIVEQLLLKTGQGQVDWAESGEDEYFLKTKSGSVVIGIMQVGPILRRDEYFVSVRNRAGTLVGRIRSDIEPPPPDFPHPQWRGALAQLHELARRRALKVDKVLDDVLNDVEAIGPDEPRKDLLS